MLLHCRTLCALMFQVILYFLYKALCFRILGFPGCILICLMIVRGGEGFHAGCKNLLFFSRHVSKGVDQCKRVFRFLKISHNLVRTTNPLHQGPSLPVGTMTQVLIILFIEGFPKPTLVFSLRSLDELKKIILSVF